MSDDDDVGGDAPVPVGVLTRIVGYHLRRAHNAFGADLQRALEGTGVRQPLFGIMATVAANPGVSQGTVGRSLGVQRANMVALINELVEAGWVDRQVAANDRRAFALTLTPAGERIVADCERRIEAHEDEMLADISPRERQVLLDLLRRIMAKER